MDDKNLNIMMKKNADKIRPRRMFALKMRYRLFMKDLPSGGMHMKFASAGLVVFLVLSGGGVGTYAYASSEVSVDHPLFPVKQGIESVERGFRFTPEQKAEHFMKMADRRMEEMEKLHEKFRNNTEMQDRADAIAKTLDYMETEMDNAMIFTDSELDVDRAERMLETFEGKVGHFKERIGKLPPVENGNPHITMVKDRIKKVHDHADERLEMMGPARDGLRKARKGEMKRIMLREFMKDGDFGKDMPPIPPEPR